MASNGIIVYRFEISISNTVSVRESVRDGASFQV